MKRVLLVLAALVGAAAVLFCVAAGMAEAPTGPIYTVAALHLQLARRGTWWLGRTVRVRAVAADCIPRVDAPPDEPCVRLPPSLIDTGVREPTLWFPIDLGNPSPLLAVLRALPAVGYLAPSPQRLRWRTVQTYRVQLTSMRCNLGQTPPCVAAVVLDAAP